MVLSAQSPKYPALYDEESRVRFILGHAKVTEEQAHKLADRPYVDGILIGDLDEDGRPINELPAKKWAAQRDGSDTADSEPGAGSGAETVTSDDATVVARKNSRSK